MLDLWHPLHPYSVAVAPDGKILIGEGYEDGIYRLNPDGSLDDTFHPPEFGVYDEEGVHAVTVQPNGKILVGGYMLSDAGTLLRLNADGSLDPSFASRTIFAGQVDAIVLQPDGRILAGGYFADTNFVDYPSVVRLLPDGDLDPSFLCPNEIAGKTLALQPDGRILAGGFSPRGRWPCPPRPAA